MGRLACTDERTSDGQRTASSYAASCPVQRTARPCAVRIAQSDKPGGRKGEQMILSASRRTDIPCWYSEWFVKRLRAGSVLVRNPMNASQISRIPLNPDVVDCIVFWTKDAGPMMGRLAEIEKMGYPYCFQYTITPYGKELESGLRTKKEILENFLELSERIGPGRMVWRYDPILLTGEWTLGRHEEAFSRMCGLLAGHADRVVVSFIDLYAKLKRTEVKEIGEEQVRQLAQMIGRIAGAHGMRIQTCCEGWDLREYGIEQGGCLDERLLEQTCGCGLDLKPDRGQRKGCGCMESIDVGAYHTCPNGCLYCYANRSRTQALENQAKHDPAGELLYGSVRETDRIYERKVKSVKTAGRQETLDGLLEKRP